jgi:Pregnancy-associated plasma protein-A/Ig-like domain CHU_C associated
LASRNPQGAYTNGITRQDGRILAGYEQNGVNHTNLASYSSLTNAAEWDTKAYININLFHSIVSAGAFAATSLYMQIGNSDNFDIWQVAYIHEMGHSLNLAHTFEGDANGTACPPNTNPEIDGDKVTDTPAHIRYEASAANAINSCTGQITGSVYNNFMSYSSYSIVSKLFSRGQIQRMRSLSFEDITRRELLFTYGLSQRNDSITYCQPLIPTNSTSYASVNLSNFFGKNYGFLHQTKTNLGTIYVQSGQVSQLNISLSHYTSPSSMVKIYLDIDRNGEFNESTEILFSSNSTYTITGNLILPNTLEVYKAYRARIVFAPNSNSTACSLIGVQPASTLFIGRILDVDLVPTSLGCNISAPVIEANSQRIKRGDFGILEANNCMNGKVYWFADSLKLYPMGEGNRLFTNSLHANTSYFAACKINECWNAIKKTTIYIDDQISNYQIQSKLISVGTNTTLIFEGCTGTVNWYSQEIGGASVFTGPSFTTPNLSQNTTYFAECDNITTARHKNRIIGLVLITSNDIVLKNSIEINICNSGTFPTVYPILSKTTSSSALYSIVFLKNSRQVYKSRLYPTYINSTTIDHNLYFEEINFPESGVYEFYVTTGNKTSQMGTIIIRKNFVVSNTINNVQSSYIQKCTNATIRLTCQPKYGQGTIPNNSEFSFQWFKDNVMINGANQNFIDITQSGNYTTVVNNGGCTQNSYGAYVANSNSLNGNYIQVDERQTEPFCAGDIIRLNSHYSSTTASYIWYKNNVVIPSLNTPSILVSENAKYSVQVTDPNCSNSPIGNTHKDIQSLDEIKMKISASDTVVCSSLNVWISLSDYNQFTKDYKIDWYKDDEVVLTGTLDVTNMNQ